jgi:fumarate hydratase class II
VVEGKFDDQFVVDVFQTGSGTSTNMNANEVIANRAIELLEGEIGSKLVHPNDHVNCCQSSNDVIPTAIHVSTLGEIEERLLPALEELRNSLHVKANEFDGIVKVGRTHLRDAVPVRMGQEFSAYVSMMEHAIRRVRSVYPHLSELPIGGTQVGTGANCHPDFPQQVVDRISGWTGIAFRQAENRFEAVASRDAAVETSAMLKTVAVSLTKLCNDLRWLSSGPRCGIGEIQLPATQPGSSIMPGKVNPVIPEAVLMVAAQVMGNDSSIAMAGQSGNFELNVMQPLIAYNLLQSVDLLSSACTVLAKKCIDGLTADQKRCEEMVGKSLAMVTSLAPHIGYDCAAEVAQEAYESGRTIAEVCLERNLLPEDKLRELLDPWRMTEAHLNLGRDRK